MLGLGTGLTDIRQTGPWYGSSALALNNVLPSYISQFDKNRYYSTTAGVRSFPYTFARASNATHFDSQGRMVWAKANMFTYSDDLTQAIWTKNDTTISAAGETAPSGAAASLATEGSAGTALLQQQLTGQGVNTPYAYTVEIKRGNHDWVRFFVGAGGNDVRAWVNLATGTLGSNSASGAATIPKAAEIVALGGGWYRCTVYAENINAVGPVFLTVSAISDNSNTRVNNGTRILGRQQLELFGPDSPKLPLSQTTTSAYYEWRRDYDPVTLAERGILIEETDTNLNPVTGEQWVNMPAVTGGFLVPNPTATMFGRRATVFQGGGTGGVQYFIPFGTTTTVPTASAEHTVSVFVRAGTRTKCQLTASGNFAPVTAYANFDLTNGTILASGAGASNVKIEPYGNSGVYRLMLTFTTVAVPASGAAVVVSFIDTDTSLRLPTITAGNADTLVVFGAQLQTGPWPTSFIPCYSTVATRIRDDLFESVGAWYNALKGTFYVDFIRQFVATGSGPAGTALQVSDGTNNERFSLVFGAGTNSQHRYDVLDLGSPVAQLQTSIGGVALTVRKMAATYEVNNFSGVENGGARIVDSVGIVPTGINTIYPGWTGTGAHLNGWLRELRYYPDNSASEAQLQALTTV